MTDETAVAIAQLGFHMTFQLGGLWILAWYRVHKKFKRARRLRGLKVWKDFCERNWIELLGTTRLVPNWPVMVREAIRLFT